MSRQTYTLTPSLSVIDKKYKGHRLTLSIRKIIALGGLTIASSASWADTLINPNEIWLEPGPMKGICAHDIDQDGDLDIFQIFSQMVTLLENKGSPESPDFSLPQVFSNKTDNLNLNRLGLSDCRYYKDNGQSVSIDIDADGDLDLFTGSSNKDGSYNSFSRNNGTTEHPVYISEDPQENFDLPDNISNFMFRDFDHDGDEDFFNTSSPFGFYENIGTPENALFIPRSNNPLPDNCADDIGFLIDLNNDNEWDILCRNIQNNTFEYFESRFSEYLPARNLFNEDVPRHYDNLQALDIDNDDDVDLIGSSDKDLVLFTNLGSSSKPQFGRAIIYASFPETVDELDAHIADLNGDGDLDFIYKVNTPQQSPKLGFAVNIGTNKNPVYKIDNSPAQLEDCNENLLILGEDIQGTSVEQRIPEIGDLTLVDIDGDDDLDLFYLLNLGGENETSIPIYCENNGDAITPLFATGVKNLFGFDSLDSFQNSISFRDMDGDGDQDAWIGSLFYDNIGNSKEPLFLQTSHPPLFSSQSIDMDGDGKIDSTLDSYIAGVRLLYKNLEPAFDIKAVSVFFDGHFILAIGQASQTQLVDCSKSEKVCRNILVLPDISQELSLSTGDFDADGEEEIVLAMIDRNGLLKVKIFNKDLKLIDSASGGQAKSISVVSARLDDVPGDEYIVSLVQSDGRVAAIGFNPDGSRIGKIIANQGKQPRIDIGQFNEAVATQDAQLNENGTTPFIPAKDDFVLAYLTPENQLETATFRADGTLISHGTGGLASQIDVSAVDISPSSLDEYVVSLIQSDGKAALIGFTPDGTRLGKVTGDIAQQPEIASLHIPNSNKSVIAVSLIQADKKPAVIFLDNQGKHIETLVGEHSASVSSFTLTNTDDDFSSKEGILTFLDEAGNFLWDFFDLKGIKY